MFMTLFGGVKPSDNERRLQRFEYKCFLVFTSNNLGVNKSVEAMGKHFFKSTKAYRTDSVHLLQIKTEKGNAIHKQTGDTE